MSRSFPLDRWKQQAIVAGALTALIFATTQTYAQNLFSPEASEPNLETGETTPPPEHENDDPDLNTNDEANDEIETPEPEEPPATSQILKAEQAYGPATDPTPRSARSTTQDEFERRITENELHLDIPQVANAKVIKIQDETANLLERARTIFEESRPVFWDSLARTPSGFDIQWTFIDSLGSKLKMVLKGRDSGLHDAVHGHLLFRSRQNQLALYERLQEKLRGLGNVPQASTNGLGWEELRHLNQQLLSLLETRFSSDTARSQPRAYDRCSLEEGSGPLEGKYEGDMTGRFCKPNSYGLRQGANWAMKYANTCVRNQGHRGTAATFALTAALESQLASARHRYVNLSEQHFFQQQKLIWFADLPGSIDNLDLILSDGSPVLRDYQFHHEETWHYNPSLWREQPGAGILPYKDSCDDYNGRYCSNTNHQSRMLCTVIGPSRFCGYEAPMPVATPYRISSLNTIFDPLNPEAGLDSVRSLVRSGIPVVASFLVPESIEKTKNDGYVPAPIAREAIRGGHVALITGWVPNSRRPAGAPEGAGGGYFVIKNSWGGCAGDSGYYYMPYEWMKAYTLSMIAVF